MQLIGMFDSPYVRRVGVSLHLLGLPFEHRPLSVFSTFEAFGRINPVVKAPTLVCGTGEVLMDSSLILQWADTLGGRRLAPAEPAALRRDLRLAGLALAGCEKAVQIVYERKLRPAEKQHQPWLDRVEGQLAAAYGALEAELAQAPLAAETAALTHGGVATAVAWSFTQLLLPGQVRAEQHPRTAAFTEAAERLPAFLACPQT